MGKREHQREESLLSHIEFDPSIFLDDRNLGFASVNDRSHLIELENQKARILKEKEEYWRLRNRAIWLKVMMITQDSFRILQKVEKYQTLYGTYLYLMGELLILSTNSPILAPHISGTISKNL